MTTRRELLGALGAGALAAAMSSAHGQRQPKVPRVALLLIGTRDSYTDSEGLALFRHRLRELGYVEGKSMLIEERYANFNAQRLNDLARELAASKVDVIVSPTVNASWRHERQRTPSRSSWCTQAIQSAPD